MPESAGVLEKVSYRLKIRPRREIVKDGVKDGRIVDAIFNAQLHTPI